MGDTLRSIVHAVSRLLRVPIAAIIRKEDAGSLPVAVGTEASPPIDPEDARLLLRAVRGSNDVIRISDAVREYGELARAARSLGMRSVILVPLRTGAHDCGVLVAGTFESHDFTDEQVEIAAVMSEQASAHIASLQLLELERADRRRAQALLEVAQAITQSSDLGVVLSGICRAAASFSVAQRCSIFLTDNSGRPRPMTGWDRGAGPYADRLAHFTSFQADLLQEERAATSDDIATLMAHLPLILDDVAEGPSAIKPWVEEFGVQSIAIYPLTTREGHVGFMNLTAHDSKVHFPPVEVEAMSAIALQAAAVIDHLSLMEQVRRQAERDSLTGLYNRRYQWDALERELETAQQTGRPLAIALLDVDGMKQLNDSQGHSAGDALLQRVATALTATFREAGSIARYGGDEFLVLMPDTPLLTAVDSSERFLSAIAMAEPSAGASIGIAAFPDNGLTAGELLDAADKAMYRAKRGGYGGIAIAHN